MPIGGDLRWLAKAAQSDLGLDRLDEFGILPEGGVRSREPRRNGVCSNSTWPQLDGERMGQIVDRCFCHRIDGRGCYGLRGGG
jgi:hypothetical protein